MKTNIIQFSSIMKTRMKWICLLLMLITLGAGQICGTEVTWDFSEDDLTDTSKGQITMSTARNNGTNAVAVESNLLKLYRQNASPYNGCSVTFTAGSGYQITAITVAFEGGRGSAKGKIDDGSYADVFSAGNNKTVTISSLTATSYSIQNQASGSTTVTISSISITYSMSGCNPITPALTYTTDSIGIGGTTTVSSLTGNTGSGTVTYSSNNTSVATVDSSTGEVTGVTTGSAIITATIAENGDYCDGSATADIIVRRGINYYIGNSSYTVGGEDDDLLVDRLPAYPSSCEEENYPYFYGWKSGTIAGSTTTPPTVLSTEQLSSSSAANTYYAVFRDWFCWVGGTSSTLTSMDGVTANGLGSDYAVGNRPYRVKLDNTGDYIIISISSQPASVAIGVKMIGGGTSSSITVQESTAADGDFTDVEELTISGSANDVVNLVTSSSFAPTTRAIKLVFTKGANVGVGYIGVDGSGGNATKYVTSCAAVYDIVLDKNSGESNGSAEVVENATSLKNISTPTRAGYHIEGYYTNAACTTKVATATGVLQPSITVSETAWTDANGKWIRGAGETFYTKWQTYGDYRFSCADLQLDEPDNSATDNVVSDVVYLTSTAGQKVRSLAHFRVLGDGLTPTQEVKFTTGNGDLDELYTFKKADGTAVMTDASGEVDEDVYVYYQPTATSDGCDIVSSVKAYVERKGDGSGKPKAVVNDERTINGRHLPAKFIIATQIDDDWYALPNGMSNNYSSSTNTVKISSVSDGVATIYSDVEDQFAYQLLASKGLDGAGFVFSSPRMSGNIIKANTTASTSTIGLYAQGGWNNGGTPTAPYFEFSPATSDLINYTLKNTFQNNYLGVSDGVWGIGSETTIRFFTIDQHAAPTITWRNDLWDSENANYTFTTNKAENGVVALPAGTPPSCEAASDFLTFDGWVTTTWSEAKTTGFTKVNGGEVATSDVTYYALFKTEDDKYFTQCPSVYTITYTNNGSLENTTYANPVNDYDVPTYLPEGSCASGKLFQGWTGASVPSLQQSLPSIVTQDGAINDVNENIDLYAVYAVRNGRYMPIEEFNGLTLPASTSYTGTNKDIGIWNVDYGCLVYNTEYANKFHSTDTVLGLQPTTTGNAGKATMTTKRKVQKLKGIRFKAATDDNAISYGVAYSTDGSTFTTKGSEVNHDGIRTVCACERIFNEAIDAYICIYVKTSTTGKKAYIDDIEFILDESAYWYSDYSTTCSKPSSATMTITDCGSITSVASNSLPYVYLVDTITTSHLSNTVPTKAGYLFSHYTINGLNYYRGDSYQMGHDVAATANWIGIPPTLSGTDIYVTSGKDISTTSSMSITATGDFHTSGTLTIANATGDQGGTFSAVITDATVSTTLNATIKVTYTPNKANVTETATMTATINGQSATFTVHGRSLPSEFVVVANTGGTTWTALPADMSVANQYPGYGVTLDNTSTPTAATLAPEAALYTFYAGSDGAVRLAATDGNHALWASRTDTKIRNYALISGADAANYQWTMTTTDNVSYTLHNANANGGAGRDLCVSDGKWGVYASGVNSFRFLPVTSTTSHINMTVTDWDEAGFTFATSDDLPGDYDNVKAVYATTTDTLAVTQTGASSPYTLDISSIDFSAHSGGTLIIQWRKGYQVKAFGTVVTPIFIKTTVSNLSDYDAESLAAMDLHISGTLNISSNTTVHNVTIASGGSLNVTSSATFHVNSLDMQGGWNSNRSSYDVPRVYIASTATLTKTNSKVNYDLTIDKSNYYPLAVPFKVAVKGATDSIDYADAYLARFSRYGTHYVIKEYDGAARAEHGANYEGNWKVVESTDTLRPGKGYIITAVPIGGKAVIRIPLSFANAWTASGEQATVNKETKNVVAVGAYTGAATIGEGISGSRHKGWNLLGVPYMSCFTGSEDLYGTAELLNGKIVVTGGESIYGYEEDSEEVPYVSVPVHDFSEYVQTPVTEAQLVPGWCFFVQIGTAGNLTFLTSKQDDDSNMPIYAPQRENGSIPVNRFALRLTGAEHADKTTVIVSNRYTTEYEIGADLEKMFGNAYTLATYTLSQGQPLAFNAMPEVAAQQLIPVGARFPEQGSYRFALAPNSAEAFERIDLMDYVTGELTNLLMTDYTFTADKGQTDSRFAINAVLRVQSTPTDINAPVDSGQRPPEKRLINGQLYIYTTDAVYDANGKRVFVINK